MAWVQLFIRTTLPAADIKRVDDALGRMGAKFVGRFGQPRQARDGTYEVRILKASPLVVEMTKAVLEDYGMTVAEEVSNED